MSLVAVAAVDIEMKTRRGSCSTVGRGGKKGQQEEKMPMVITKT